MSSRFCAPFSGLEERRFDYASVEPAQPEMPTAQSPTAYFAAEDVLKAVISALGPAPVAMDAIARQTGLNAQAVQIALLELDLAGRIERQGRGLVALKAV